MIDNSVWRTSRWSMNNAACVEVAHTEDFVRVRDSKLTHSPVLAVAAEQGRAFLGAVKVGQFDR
jgi:hypothetical protein